MDQSGKSLSISQSYHAQCRIVYTQQKLHAIGQAMGMNDWMESELTITSDYFANFETKSFYKIRQ